MGADNIDIDLRNGQIIERKLEALLRGSTIECKDDSGKDGKHTGNVFVEYHSREKPSGIAISERDWWFFVLADDKYKREVVVGLKTARLRRLIKEGNYPTRPGGDKLTSSRFLVKIKGLLD